MKRMTAKVFYFPTCPYCVKAKRAIEELKEDYPEYQNIEIEWIDEHKNVSLADQYDYYYVPTIFYGEEKLYEASPAHSYDDIRKNIHLAFDTMIRKES
jgi:glutaredoxin